MNYEKRLSEQPHEPVRQGFIRELLVVESLPGVAAVDKNADEDHLKYLDDWPSDRLGTGISVFWMRVPGGLGWGQNGHSFSVLFPA